MWLSVVRRRIAARKGLVFPLIDQLVLLFLTDRIGSGLLGEVFPCGLGHSDR